MKGKEEIRLEIEQAQKCITEIKKLEEYRKGVFASTIVFIEKQISTLEWVLED